MAKFSQYTKKNGSTWWSYQAYLGVNEFGKEVRTTRRGFKTKKEAQLALNQLLVDYQNGQHQQNKIMTFKELYDLWLENHRLRVKKSTVATNRRFIEQYVLKYLGDIEVNKISVVQCQKIVNKWHEQYKQYAYFRKITAQVLQFGVQLEILADNPMRKTLLPRKKEEDTFPNFYTKEQLELFFSCLEEHVKNDGRTGLKLQAFFRILAFTGLRKSEVLSLQWEDIDFFNQQLKVGKTLAVDEHGQIIVQTPKTESSTRIIALDKITIKLLQQWRSDQMKWYLKFGYNTSSEQQYLFTNKFNELYYPQAPNDWLYNILEKYDLTKITLHGFRHTHASLLFESGATPKDVQERLGHKDIKTTMNIYTHVTPNKIKETGEQFSKYVNF